MTYPIPGLDAAGVRAMEAQMRGSYRMRVRAELRDFQHNFVRDLSAVRMGGNVQVTADGEGPTRTLQLDLHDPTDMLGLGDGEKAVTPNRMVVVWRGIYVDVLERWVDCPVFMGPITKPSRADDVLSIEAQDKVAFAADPRPAYTVKAGTNVATAIRQVMGNAVGETRFRLAATSRKLSKSHTLSREQSPWALVQRICQSVGWVAFYDGGGYLVARPRPTTPVVEFRTGTGELLRSEVQTGYWDGDIFNQVTVVGAVISKTAITATSTLAASHPLSPESMRVGSVRWFKTEVIEDGDISAWPQARDLATRRLRELSIQQTTASFESIAWWHLQEYDPYVVQTPSGSTTASVTEMTIPLDAEGAQSMGHNRRTPLSKRQARVRPKPARLTRAEANARRAAAKARAEKRAAARKRAIAEKKRAAAARKRKARKK